MQMAARPLSNASGYITSGVDRFISITPIAIIMFRVGLVSFINLCKTERRRRVRERGGQKEY